MNYKERYETLRNPRGNFIVYPLFIYLGRGKEEEEKEVQQDREKIKTEREGRTTVAAIMESAGGWLEKTLVDLGLDLDRDIISGLVSYCELAQPLDAKEYLLVIPFSSLSFFVFFIRFWDCFFFLLVWAELFESLSLTCNRSLLSPTFRHLLVFLSSSV